MSGEGLERVPADHKASGNEAVQELLDEAAAECRLGRFRYASLVLAENAGHAVLKQGGSTGCEAAAFYGHAILQQALLPKFGTGGQAAEALPLNYACYDLRRAPLSFDFIPWLVDREMARIRYGAEGPLRVGFTEPAEERAISDNNRLMLDNVIMPIVEMIGGVIDQTATKTFERAEFYCNRPIVDAAMAGETVPMLKPRPGAVAGVAKTFGDSRPVTITLREAAHDAPRNSRTDAWLRFARELRDAGERVIILRDTAKADEPIEDFETFPAASRNIQVRLALYTVAKQNFFVSNGPVTLAMFSEVPYIFLNEVLDYNDSSNKTESWTLYHGTKPGEQVPWVKPNQRIVWAAETYENMRSAWNDFNALKQAA